MTKASPLRLACLAIVLAAASATPPRLPAQTPAGSEARPPGATDQIGPLLLRDESIDQVLALIERWTGKTVLRPQALPTATVTLTLKGGVTREEAIRALETVLALNGVAVSPLDDKFLKVTPLASAKSEAPELIDGSTLPLPPSGRIASKIFQLDFLRVAELIPQIAPLLNPAAGSPPVIFEKANAALVTDSLTTLQRIETLIAKLDRPVLTGLQPKFYPLHFAKASEVVNRIRTIFSGPLQNQIGTATTYNADDRTNQLILVSDPRQHAFFDELIAKLDVKSDPNTRNEVIYLKHAAAKDVATILSQLVSGQNNAAKTLGTESARPYGQTAPANAPASGPSGQPAPTPPPPAVAVAPLLNSLGLAPESSNQFSQMLTILPEERSNSIVISGTVDDVRLINELVAKLDVLLAQVRIEVVIAEVTLGNNATSGISELGLTITGDKLVGGSALLAGAEVKDVVVTTPGVVGTGPYDLAAVVNLATTPRKTNATILSQPNIITTHNKEGKIFVGESRPVISSYLNDSTGTTAGLGGYRSTVQPQKIGIELTVKPLIGTDGSVQLEIKQKVDDILGEITIDGNPQPRIGNRETESFVSVRSGEIIVLGGLQRTSKSRSTSRLGPIPIIGDLLGTRSREDTRTDLVFFLRPTVLTNTPADNVAALKQVEEFPKKQREKVKEALGLAPAKE
ncbi:MAG: secretin N-terminal domain-containing protein [Verrucomicrobiota bacterium]